MLTERGHRMLQHDARDYAVVQSKKKASEAQEHIYVEVMTPLPVRDFYVDSMAAVCCCLTGV